MRSLLVAFSLLTSAFSFAQAFHFNDTVTVLVKDVTQSPAHWYLEVFNDVGVDTTLRWKTSFSNVPAQWNISFDDQDNFYATINDGDSAEFTAFAGLAFPQKLIIGAEFNGVATTASVFFDIYDPANPSYVVTIEYRFVVSPVGLEEVFDDHLIQLTPQGLLFDDVMLGGELYICDLSGKIITHGTIEKQMPIDTKSGQIVLIKTYWSNKFYQTRLYF